MMRALKYLLAIAGLIVICAMVWVEGYADVARAGALVGWGLAVVCVLEVVPLTIKAWVWRDLLPGAAQGPLGHVVMARWIRQSVSQLLPVAQVGGDAGGARLLYLRGLQGDIAGASTVVDMTLGAWAQVAFSVLGIVLFVPLQPPQQLLVAIMLATAVIGACLVGFLLTQFNGLFQRGARGTAALSRGLLVLVDDAARLDQAIVSMYRQTKPVLRNFAVQTAVQVAGSLEVWLICWFAGTPVDLVSAVLLQSLSRTLRAAAFFVPGGLGVQEGGLILLAPVVGLDSTGALVLALTKRVREILVGLPALVWWARIEQQRL